MKRRRGCILNLGQPFSKFFGLMNRPFSPNPTSLADLYSPGVKLRSQSKVSFKKKQSGIQQVVLHVDQTMSKDDIAFNFGETSVTEEGFPFCQICKAFCETCKKKLELRHRGQAVKLGKLTHMPGNPNSPDSINEQSYLGAEDFGTVI